MSDNQIEGVDYFRIEDLARAAGLTYTNIYTWSNRGHLKFTVGRRETGGSGRTDQRRYSRVELEVACRMPILIEAGLTHEAAATVARFWAEHPDATAYIGDGIGVTPPRPDPTRDLVTRFVDWTSE